MEKDFLLFRNALLKPLTFGGHLNRDDIKMTNFTNVVLNDCVCELLEKLLAMCSGNFFLQSKIEAQICVVTFLVLARNKDSI